VWPYFFLGYGFYFLCLSSIWFLILVLFCFFHHPFLFVTHLGMGHLSWCGRITGNQRQSDFSTTKPPRYEYSGIARKKASLDLTITFARRHGTRRPISGILTFDYVDAILWERHLRIIILNISPVDKSYLQFPPRSQAFIQHVSSHLSLHLTSPHLTHLLSHPSRYLIISLSTAFGFLLITIYHHHTIMCLDDDDRIPPRKNICCLWFPGWGVNEF
jgi:hypothetical protein